MKLSLHSCFLLLTGTRATILRAGLVELPHEVHREGAAGRVLDGQFAIAIDDGIGFVGIEDVIATQVERERTQPTQADVALYTEIGLELSLLDAEVVHMTFRTSCEIGTHSPALRQFDVVLPREIEVWAVERLDSTNSRALLAYP